jgi:hypothetical protein
LGSSGTSGTSGVNGTFFGSSGTSGINGITGDAGSSGTSGTNAPGFSSGTSGSGGSSGLNGTFFGSSGTSGTNSPGITSGTSGTNGFGLTGTTNDGLLTYTNAPVGANVESNLTFDGTTLGLTGNITQTGNINVTGYVGSTTYRETFSDLGAGGSTTIDLSTANNFKRTFNGTATVTISNAPNSPIGFGFTLVTVNAGAYAITWPASVDWVGGSAPILTSSGTDVLVFYTYDGGTTYYGFVTGKNLS